MADQVKKFGKYFLLDQIAQGGMAEIYVARLASQEWGGRLLVIKRIQNGYGSNQDFISMFRSEIKVTMAFSHPNIVQLFDFGEENNQPYIAMEFVDGKNLRQVLNRFKETKATFPIDIAVFMISQAAAGLYYAHTFKDKLTGEALQVVHRDVSPQNIIVSYEGNVKVIDFGIAKATTNSESTQAGVIKGKPSYLSPEQISGQQLDGRSDVFALGTVFWELLTGRKLFQGDNDLAVLKQIESANSSVKAPSTVNPSVPHELDTIVLKALAKQREKRYQNAEEFQRVLHKFLYSNYPDFNPADLSFSIKRLFQNEIIEERKHVQRLNEKAEAIAMLETMEPPTPASAQNNSGMPELDTSNFTRKEVLNIEMDKSKSEKIELDPVTSSMVLKFPKKPEFDPENAVPRLQKVATRDIELPRFQDSKPSIFNPGALQQERSKQTRVSGSMSRGVPAPKKESSFGKIAIALLVLGGGGWYFLQEETSKPTANVQGKKNQQTVGELYIDGDSKDAEVFINGQKVATGLPADIKDVNAGVALSIQVSGAGIQFKDTVQVVAGDKKIIKIASTNSNEPPAGMDPMKSIAVKMNPIPGWSQTDIFVAGKKVDPAQPVIWVQYDQPFEIVAVRQGYKKLVRQAVMDSRQLASLKEWVMDLELEPETFGRFSLTTTPRADVYINNEKWPRGTPLVNEKLPPGRYQVLLKNELLGMEKKVEVLIEEGKPTALESVNLSN